MNLNDIETKTYNPDEIDGGLNEATAATPPRRRIRKGGQCRHDKKGVDKKTTADDGEKQSFFNSITDRRISIFTGIVLLLAAAYITIVAISYYAHGGDDQSIVTSMGLDEMSGQASQIKNTGGPFGAWLSDLLFSKWLGVGSFILVFYMFALGLQLLKVHRFKFWSLTSRSLVSAIATSVVLGFVNIYVPSHFYWGGQHGFVLNCQLIELSGVWGALVVNLLLISLVILLYFNDLKAFYDAYRRKMEQHRAARLERERIEEAMRQEKLARQAQLKKEKEKKEEADATIEDRADVSDTIGRRDKADEDEPFTLDEPLEESPDAEDDDSSIVDEDVDDISLSVSTEATDDPPIDIDCPTIDAAETITTDVYDPTAELSRYRFPTLDLLIDRGDTDADVDMNEQDENKERITKTLNDFGIAISRIKATVGPTVTLYEIIPAEGVRIAKIKRLEDDIALNLSALGIRIIAPIPGKGTIGIEVPNKNPQTVSIRSIIGSRKFQECRMELPMALGCTISNEVFIADLCKMPHLLVAGATGMGKSVGLNTIITSLLYKKHPAELKFVLIDPKMVEFSLYSKLERHYLAKLPDEEEAIITNVNKAVATLNSLCVEMDNRYSLLKLAGARNIKEYNTKFINRTLNPEKGHRYMPYIVVIVDEFADLIMQVGKEVETPIARIAQKARAIGMHMILATQRPSTNVITGVIKANFPGRVAFRVFQMVDSRTILDRPGANQLIGRGDMLFSTGGNIERVQCAFIDTPEVDAICDSIAEQVGYPCPYELPEYVAEESEGGSMASLTDRDPLFEEAARLVITSGQASTSSLQRRYSIGYNRAGKIMDQMEAAGIVGPSQGGKPRQVLIDQLQLDRLLEM